ncbi:hypothetical protein BJY01DRAFT_64025 [Aspergillus pseudoustus]|uniref:Uncharacterized protein n=1 Tax=Aspergillus pseudoustus TaxID=1810923 RepID=A0ABR4KMC1_9EURO
MHFPTFLTSTLLLSLSSLGAVTAQALEEPHGIDSGNTACVGACVADPKLLACPRVEYRPQYGCYMCCVSDDDLDRIEPQPASRPLDDDEAYHQVDEHGDE